MGRRNNRKNVSVFDDSDDDDSVSSTSTAMSDLTVAQDIEEVDGTKDSLEQCLNDLYEKRGSTREKALALLVDAFTNKLQNEFVANKCITLLHQCLNSIKRGSAKEIYLACHVIGLLAITVGCDDSATHEILDDSVGPLSQGLKSASDLVKISSILDCLAIITFIGGNDSDETEKSMQIMWQFIYPKSGPNVVKSKLPSPVLTAAISAWTFLLTTMDVWRIDSKIWKESISYFSSLLDKEDRPVRIAAGEALAVIFATGTLEKFSAEAKSSPNDSSVREGYVYVQGLKAKIINQVRDLSVEAGGKGSAKKDLNSQRNLFRDILDFLEDGYCPETRMKIGGDVLSVSTWSQLIQLNFMKRFLGGGFAKHMQENELLHSVFGFNPKKKNLSDTEQGLSGIDKRLFKSPNSFLNKARTQDMNKRRMISQGKNTGHYALTGDEEA